MDDLADSRIVIVGEGDETKGFLVDAVREVVWVEDVDLEAVEPGRFAQFGGLITGVAKLDPLVWLPDVAKLLAGRVVGDGGDEPATQQNAPIAPDAAEPASQPRPPPPITRPSLFGKREMLRLGLPPSAGIRQRRRPRRL